MISEKDLNKVNENDVKVITVLESALQLAVLGEATNLISMMEVALDYMHDTDDIVSHAV